MRGTALHAVSGTANRGAIATSLGHPEGAFGQVAIDSDGGEQLPYLFHQQLLLAPQCPDLAQQFVSGRLAPNTSLAGAGHFHIGKVANAGA
ncbi:MAG: hypothetical protein ACLQU1_32535 [Bryobacteraceae bacterium]